MVQSAYKPINPWAIAPQRQYSELFRTFCAESMFIPYVIIDQNSFIGKMWEVGDPNVWEVGDPNVWEVGDPNVWEVGDWGSKFVGGGRLGVKIWGRWEIGRSKFVENRRLGVKICGRWEIGGQNLWEV